MSIGINGVVRVEHIREGETIQCSCGAGKIQVVCLGNDGNYRARCVCGRIISISNSGAYTPAYPSVSEVARAT